MEVGKINETGIEIERKYLLRRVSQKIKKGAFRSEDCHIYYRKKGEQWVRATVVNSHDRETDTREKVFIETIKKHIAEGTCEEYERYLTPEETRHHLNNSHTYIHKTRYFYKEGEDIWEVDEFHNLNLAMAELEVASMDDDVEIPEVIQEDLISEVTGDKSFSNQNLAPAIG